MGKFRMMRVYDQADGGYRVLVDRLWPRGMSRELAQLDEWAKDVAPSTELRSAFGHREERFEEFKNLYLAELENGPAAAEVDRLLGLAKSKEDIVLLFGAKDTEHNQAVVLLEHLNEAMSGAG
ncbi:DUF488 domain-containing protein [Paeniglutamicibacter cryotolerans]|uniref:Uncharacterized protein YeaO (DUF488 family) n=1 Tax=Paeniglutamicibacter cryotolerans TaxID=670079 RepID=A0A839QL48_9MICC|nr:DUF488 family protein [Paeniglutamicibacter cryotolerans]MBB2996939.1 uncharacterized protein YeaO (DUF488 family) [Paeniglutamicibacter cryotolerans]